jgi:hypothetical protein
MAKPTKTKGWTPNQLARLPDPGYLYSEYRWKNPGEDYLRSAVTLYCVKNGAVKYNRGSWARLLWSCCPTRQQIAKASKQRTANAYTLYEHFADHDSLLAAHPELQDGFREKAPNDF